MIPLHVLVYLIGLYKLRIIYYGICKLKHLFTQMKQTIVWNGDFATACTKLLYIVGFVKPEMINDERLILLLLVDSQTNASRSTQA